MNIGGSSHGNDRSKKGNRRTWSKIEEEALLNVLDDVVAKGYRTENGTFKPGTLGFIEKSLLTLCPGSDLKANPHIESKLKKWKRDYGVIFDMVNKSGFGWNDTKKCVEVDSNEVWEAYLQINKDADGWRDRPFPMYDRLANIYGVDRATGKAAETPADMVADLDINDETECQPTNIRDDEDNSPMSVGQNSCSKQVNQIQSNRRKRSRSSDGIAVGLESIAASLSQMVDKADHQVLVLADSIRPKIIDSDMRQFLLGELKRLGFFVSNRVKALKIFMAEPYNFDVFKELDEDEKLEFISEMVGDSSHG